MKKEVTLEQHTMHGVITGIALPIVFLILTSLPTMLSFASKARILFLIVLVLVTMAVLVFLWYRSLRYSQIKIGGTIAVLLISTILSAVVLKLLMSYTPLPWFLLTLITGVSPSS